MKNLVLFASGAGSNAENIIQYFHKGNVARVVAIFTNNPNAGVLSKAILYDVSAVVFTREGLESGVVLNQVNDFNPDLIVLAGFLLKLPSSIVDAFPQKTINIHPALLPKYGGKGMYGMNVHRAILENNDDETGISIHYVDANYDSGDLIFQHRIAVDSTDTPDTLARKIQDIEHQHFPIVIEQLLLKS